MIPSTLKQFLIASLPRDFRREVFAIVLQGLVIARAAAAPDASFQWMASTAPIQLGEKTVLMGKVRLREATVLEIDLASSATDTFLITSHQVRPSQDPPDEALRDIAVEILPLTVGRLPVFLTWTLLQGARDAVTLKSPPVVVEIAEPQIAQDATPRDIKEPLSARMALWPWLLAALLIAAGYYLYRRWSRRKTPMTSLIAAVPQDTRTPNQRALNELDELEASPLWGENKHKEFYAILTDILRRYFDGRYGIPAQYLTTSEFARQLRQAEIERKIIFRIRDVFDRADLVKFAKIVPDEGSGAADVNEARAVVIETAPSDQKAALPL